MNTWKIDTAHAEIAFKVRHLMISTIRGIFTDFEGNISAKDDTLDGGTINFTTNTNSISTNNKDRNEHLMSADFFDSAKFPTMSFVSTSIKRVKNELNIKGNLTIKDTTKEVELKASLSDLAKGMESEKVIGVELFGKINRSDFGLVWNVALETGGVLIGDQVIIEAFLEIKEA